MAQWPSYKLKTALPTPYYLLFLSYLTDRNFQIKHNTATSTILTFRSGVPQGIVIGPLLYLLFTADIPTTQNTTIATFADDTVIIAANEDPPPRIPLPTKPPRPPPRLASNLAHQGQ